MTEVYSIKQASKISSDFQYLVGKVFKGYTVKNIGMFQLPNDQPLYTVEVILVSQTEEFQFVFSTIHSFCFENGIAFDYQKYEL